MADQVDNPLAEQREKARNKGLVALGSATTTVLFTWLLSWGFLVLGVPVTAALVYRWLKYRAEWGMKF
jgi:hypothetical protein